MVSKLSFIDWVSITVILSYSFCCLRKCKKDALIEQSGSCFFLTSSLAIMTTLLPVFKLKNLLSHLDDNEFDGVFTKLRMNFGREYVMELMCSSAISSLLQNENHDSMDKITDIVTTIIRQKNQRRDPRVPAQQHITKLPTSVVGEIASYLPQRSYFRFTATNRKMFVDCHSPNRLSTLHLASRSLTDYSSISLQSYPKLSKLIFKLPRARSLSTINENCRRLKSVVILVDDINLCDGTALETNLHEFMVKNASGFYNVTTLAIYRRTAMIQSSLLIRLLSLFPNLNHLSLSGIGFRTSSMLQQLPSVCPSIRQLFCYVVPDDISILRTLSSTLDTLSLNQGSIDPVGLSFDNFDWLKLERLCLMAPSRNVMSQFLENAKRLKQICFAPNVYACSARMTAQGVGLMTRELFTDYPSLEFIYISTRGHFERICNSIHSGLYHTRKLERELLEIALHLDSSEIEDLDDFICNISKILTVISVSKTKQWMMTLEPHQQYDSRPMVKAIRELIDSYPGLDIKLLYRSTNTLVVGNSECKALPHRHWWNDCMAISFY